MGAGMACAWVTSSPGLPAPQGQPTLSVPNKMVLLVTTAWSKASLCQCQIWTVVMPWFMTLWFMKVFG